MDVISFNEFEFKSVQILSAKYFPKMKFEVLKDPEIENHIEKLSNIYKKYKNDETIDYPSQLQSIFSQ